MSALSTKVRRLREQVRDVADRGTATKARIGQLHDKVAELVLDALFDEHHPLTSQLHDLEEWVDREEKYWRSQEGKAFLASPPSTLDPPPSHNSRRLLFMPMPGLKDPQ